MNELERNVFEMYRKEINDEHCEFCKEYDKKLSSPLKRNYPQSFFHIGKNLVTKSNKKRIIFVGKNSWNTKNDIKVDPWIGPIKDLSKFGSDVFNQPDKYPHSVYWKYIMDITREVNLTFDDIAITNLVKCNIYDTEENRSVNITKLIYS